MISEKRLSPLLLPIRKLSRAIRANLMSTKMGMRLPLHILLGIRINRDQWISDEDTYTYNKLMTLSWEETELYAPKYFKRLKFSLGKARGTVLELGCGMGTMTRWLSESENTEKIWAVDSSKRAIKQLKSYKLPKVTPLNLPVENLSLAREVRFDTVMICELLEHIYPDEEIKMLRFLDHVINPKTRFVVSVPIGKLPDPYHVRSFSKQKFRKHLMRFYGNPIEVDYSSGYSQIAWGFFRLDRSV